MTLRKDGYRTRVVDRLISDRLMSFGALCLEGPKWCGKTWTALSHAESVVYIGDPTGDFQNRTLARLNPSLILDGASPRVIDEWQEVPSIWDAVRFRVDDSGLKGGFLLTGSATPRTKGILHSGTGRIDRIMMRPMSLFESGDSNGTVSLHGLFNGGFNPVKVPETDLLELIALMVRGGWPGALHASPEEAIDISKSYLRSVIENDLVSIDGTKRDRAKIGALIRSLARNVGTLASNRTLQRDIMEFDHDSVDPDTIASYLDVLARLFLVENLPAFDPNYRSSTRVAKSPKRYFVDPSLAVAALGLGPKMLLEDLRLCGLIFESMVIRDLRVHAEAMRGKVFHYRHHDTGDEIDAIVEFDDGSWGAFEVKLGHHQVDDAAARLVKIQNDMNQSGEAKSPSVLGVICGLCEYAYRRDDGVYVLPVTALKD